MQVIAWHFCHVQAFCRLLLPVLVTTVKLWVTVLGWFFFTTNWKFGFVFDPWSHNLQLLVLELFHFVF